MNKLQKIQQDKLLLQKLLKRVGYRSTNGSYRPNIQELVVESTLPTSDRICGNGFVRKTTRYSGSELLGIGTLHKSNAVPIRKDSNDAIHIAKMRRG